MSELNLKCHFQMVRNKTQYGEEFTVHEAFSTDKGQLYMVCPAPVYVVGDSKEDVSELTSMIDKDIIEYGIVDMPSIQAQFDKYAEYTTFEIEEQEIDFSDMMNIEEELIADDYHDDNGKILDLVDFIKKRK